MPELPDVAGFKMYFDATALRQRIAQTHVPDRRIVRNATPALIGRRLKGETFTRTHRHGKYLFAAAGEAGWLVMHFGMTGELQYEKTGGEAPRFARFVVEFANGHRLAYLSRRMLGHVGFTDDAASFIEDQKLGPDALDDALTLGRFRDMLVGRRGMLKSLLMDQSFIAGPGNIWVDEILHQAKLHPEQAVDALGADQVRRLHRKLRHALELGAERGGDVDRLPRRWLMPHREQGAACPACGGEIQKKTVGGRATYLCPECQRKNG